MPLHPEKVVVFDNGALDILAAIGETDAVIGAATQNLPDYLEATFGKVESSGGIKEPDLEKINAQQPDLIIISGRQSDYYDQLSAIAPTLYVGVDNADPLTSMEDNMALIGKIFGKDDAIATKITALNKKVAAVKEKASSAGSTLFVMVNEGSISAFGVGSRFGVVYDGFGFTPADQDIEASTHGQSVSYEYIAEVNPDILFVLDRTQAIGGDDSQNKVADNALVAQTTAGKTNKVITVSPDVWYLATGGYEATEIMLEDVAQAFE